MTKPRMIQFYDILIDPAAVTSMRLSGRNYLYLGIVGHKDELGLFDPDDILPVYDAIKDLVGVVAVLKPSDFVRN